MLTSSEQQDLVRLLENSGRAAYSSRNALCIEIEVEAGRLTFMQESPHDFAVQLVDHLLRTHRYNSLRKLCDEIENVLGGDLKTQIIEIRTRLSERRSQESDRALASNYEKLAATKDEQARAELARRASEEEQQSRAQEDERRSFPEKLDAYFRMIKLEQAASGFEQVYARIRSRGGAALFVLHPSLEFGGDWLLKRIKAKLRSETDVPPLERPIQDLTSDLSWEFSFLRRLGEYYNVTPERRDTQPSADELDRYRDAIISKMITAPVASRILIEIRQADRLFSADSRALEWFLNRFWPPLVEAVNEAITVRKIIILAILVADGEVRRKNLTKDRWCHTNNFESTHMLELRLKPCSVDDIFEWFTDQLKLETQRAEADARTCYEVSKGKQLGIYQWVLTYKRGALT